jgi:hypothetical protein
MDKTGIKILNGMEWTSFYGHMVTLGIKKYEDWRYFTPDNIHEGIKRVHNQGGIAGVAHPFRLGDPICTGGSWEYATDWNDIDYMEVWSGLFPPAHWECRRSYEMWTELLNKGYRITAVSGRDWHSTSGREEYVAVTYLGMHEDEAAGFEKAALEAISGGRVCVTLGPLLHLAVKTCLTEKYFEPGDEAVIYENEVIKVDLDLDFSVRRDKWQLPGQVMEMILASNLGSMPVDVTCSKGIEYTAAGGLKWLRAELYTVINGVRTLAAFTNPVYFMNNKN